MTMKKPSPPKPSLPRRTFLKLSGLTLPLAAFFGRIPQAVAGWWEQGQTDHWEDGIFVQKNVDTGQIEKGIIRANIDGHWDEYAVTELDDAFMEWNLTSRLGYLETISKGQMPSLAGPHAAAVATYGGGRRDTRFLLNNAIKGMGFAPRREKIGELTERLKSTMAGNMEEKLDILKENYRHPEWWDRTLQVSLELYTRPDFETHTFLNLMANPTATIVFTDMPSYELRAIVRMIHPQDEKSTSYERGLLEYSNLAHDYFHGPAQRRYSLLAFHVVEQFDNSPGEGMGIRVRPPLPEK
jgi:hypothetical protein